MSEMVNDTRRGQGETPPSTSTLLAVVLSTTTVALVLGAFIGFMAFLFFSGSPWLSEALLADMNGFHALGALALSVGAAIAVITVYELSVQRSAARAQLIYDYEQLERDLSEDIEALRKLRE